MCADAWSWQVAWTLRLKSGASRASQGSEAYPHEFPYRAFKRNRGPFFSSPYDKDHNVLGPTLGPLIYGDSSMRGFPSALHDPWKG